MKKIKCVGTSTHKNKGQKNRNYHGKQLCCGVLRGIVVLAFHYKVKGFALVMVENVRKCLVGHGNDM